MRIHELTENLASTLAKGVTPLPGNLLSTLAKGAATAIKSAPTVARTAPAVAGWASKPNVASEISKMSPALQREFLVRFPNPAATNKALDDIYSQAQGLHNSGNKAAAKSLLDAHDNLNMMSLQGPTDQLMMAFKTALKNQTQ